MADEFVPPSTGSHPRISVIIPTYNAAGSIARAIDSVLAQSYPAHEIIVIDDGSTDNTAELLGQYGSSVRYERQANTGPSAARNLGVEKSRGDWIAFLDSDDWYLTDRLLVHAEMIRQDPDLDFLVASFDYVDDSGRLIEVSIAGTDLGRELLKKHGSDGRAYIEGEDIGRFISNQFSDTRGLTLPRSKFHEAGGFPKDLRICEDVAFMLRLCACSQKAGVACRSLSVYTVHERGLIRSDRLRAQTETVRALTSLAREMLDAPAPIHSAWKSLVKSAYHNLAYYLVKNGRKSEALSSLWSGFRFQPALSDLRPFMSVLKG